MKVTPHLQSHTHFVTIHRSAHVSSFTLVDSCNNDCDCDTAEYSPVCMNNVEYMTPCHAGCPMSVDAYTAQVSLITYTHRKVKDCQRTSEVILDKNLAAKI